MPELPEVQTVINGLIELVLNKTITSINEYRKGTVIWHCNKRDLGSISSIERRGKYIIIKTSAQFKIVIHLRMTGKLIYEKDYNFKTDHTRAEIGFDDNTKLLFNDVRTFGKIEIYNQLEEVESINKLGVEPLSEFFSVDYLFDKIKQKKAPIKNILLDQRIIAGLGNIYVCEILYRSGINPETSGSKLDKTKIDSIVLHTKQVLEEAIKHNGTTISDYRNVDDKTGEFQNFLKVYGKKQCQCNTEILRIKQAGRSTFYCPQCQQ